MFRISDIRIGISSLKERVAAFRINDAGTASSGGHYRAGDGMKEPAVGALRQRAAAPVRVASAGGGAAQVQEF
jgi:hypothetical protein